VPPPPAPRRIPASAAADHAATAAAEKEAKELRYLQARRIEDIAQAFVSLASELWIVKDRMAVLEQVLDRHGIPAPAAVEAYAPQGEFKATLDAERRAWAQRMIAALFPRGLPKAD
jgi:predicted NAD/FAD-binding protein